MNYLMEDTTKEERMEMVQKALAISLSGASMPSEEALKLADDYIERRRSLEEIQILVIKKYQKNKGDIE